MSKATRRTELSLLNVLFCIMVVLIHVLSDSVQALNPRSWQFFLVYLCQRISFISVPGFFLLSGLKLTLGKDSIRLRAYYKKRAIKIVLPYVIAVTVYVAYFTHIGWEVFSIKNLIGYIISGRIASHFYFVVTLVQFILLTPLWLYLIRRYDAVILLPIALLITLCSQFYFDQYAYLILPNHTLPAADRIFPSYLVFYLAGCYIGAEYERFIHILESNRIPVLLSFLIFALLDLVFSSLNASGIQAYPALNLFHISCEGLGILAFFLLALRFRNRTLPMLLRKLDEASYLIYLYHCLAVQFFIIRIQSHISDMAIQLLLRSCFVYLITVSGSLLWNELIRKIRQNSRAA